MGIIERARTAGRLGSLIVVVAAVIIGAAASPVGAAPATPVSLFRWSAPAAFDPGHQPVSLTCPTVSFCAAVDGKDRAIMYDGHGGRAVPLDDGSYTLTSVSCSSPKFCVAVDDYLSYFTWNGSTWSGAGALTASGGEQVSCGSPTFCLAASNAYGGDAIAYNGSQWSDTGSGTDLFLPSCPRGASGFCAFASDAGTMRTYQHGTWGQEVGVGYDVYALSCTSPSFCMAIGIGTTGQWTGHRWKKGAFPGQAAGVSCASTTFCMAASGHDVLAWSGHGWASQGVIDAKSPLVSIACPTVNRCFALDATGHILVGTRR